jgi:D-arabinose 1-dehydrogenase-like Zn-dependent alcohol dehydrogenase
MPKMKVVQVHEAGAEFQVVERDIPDPPAGHVRLRVLACGVCHSDAMTKDGLYPGVISESAAPVKRGMIGPRTSFSASLGPPAGGY